MQTISNDMQAAIRGSYQVPLARLEVYNQDGSLSVTISDVITCNVDTANSRKVLRTFSAEIDDSNGVFSPDPDQFERNVLWYNKTVKVFLGYMTGIAYNVPEYLPQGEFTIDSIKPTVTPTGVTLEISGQDKMSKLLEDQFDDVYTVEDVAATESVNYALATSGASAAASSSVAAGDDIRGQGRIHYADTYATIGGVPQTVANMAAADTDPDGVLRENGWRFTYTPAAGEVVTQIEAEIFVDLQSEESLQGIQINLETGTELTNFVYTSPDNAAWTSYNSLSFTPSGSVRFIRFRVRKLAASGSSWTLAVFKVRALTSQARGPALAIDGDVYFSHWRPRTVDLDPNPSYTIDMGQARTINAIYLYWGNDSFDFWNRVSYYLETSTNGTAWARVNDLNGLGELDKLFGDVEHVINSISCRYIRITIKARYGVAKLRHVKAVNVSSTQTVDKVIRDVLATTQIQDKRIGKNIVPPLEEWTINGQGKIIGKYKAEITVSGNGLENSIVHHPIYVEAGKQFTLSGAVKIPQNITAVAYNVVFYGPSPANQYLGEVGTRGEPVTFTTPAGISWMMLRLQCWSNATAGIHTFEGMMLQEGAVATAFEPRKKSIMIPKTRRWIKKRQASIGDDKESFCRLSASSVGWVDPFMDQEGAYTTGPRNIDPTDPAWEFATDTDNIFSFAPLLTNDISNVIVVVYESSDGKGIVGRAIDNNPLSPTYIGKLGRRVMKYEGESYDTQDKCDRLASQKLFERTRFKHQTSLPVTGHPAILPDDVILVTVEDAKIQNYYYLVTGSVSSFDAEAGTFDTRFNISQL